MFSTILCPTAKPNCEAYTSQGSEWDIEVDILHALRADDTWFGPRLIGTGYCEYVACFCEFSFHFCKRILSKDWPPLNAQKMTNVNFFPTLNGEFPQPNLDPPVDVIYRGLLAAHFASSDLSRVERLRRYLGSPWDGWPRQMYDVSYGFIPLKRTFLLDTTIFRCELLVSGRVCPIINGGGWSFTLAWGDDPIWL